MENSRGSFRSRGSRIDYSLPILKKGRRNISVKSRDEISARYGIPYPLPHEEINLKGLLVDEKVYLYDLAEYDYLRFHRGFFGEYNRVTPYDPDKPQIKNNYKANRNEFPPSSSTFPVASLNLSESYFLSCICGCLEIWDWRSLTRIMRQDLMNRYTVLDPLFPYFFAVYFHFRRKKYTVKSGVKFGTDFVLYEYGPSRTHSLYSVYIVIPNLRDPGLAAVDAMQRASNSVKKEVILAQVIAPPDMSAEDLNKPDCFTKMHITEVIVRRRETLTTFSDKSQDVGDELAEVEDVPIMPEKTFSRGSRVGSRWPRGGGFRRMHLGPKRGKSFARGVNRKPTRPFMRGKR